MSSAHFEISGAERIGIRSYLEKMYAGVFTDAAIEAHLDNHVGFAASDYALAVMSPHVKRGSRLLDVGAGFGSCVLAARERGFDAHGIETAMFEVEFARRRLRLVRPQDDPEDVYQLGSFLEFSAPAASFDVVTFWNVLEHIEDLDKTLSVARHLLRKDGLVYVVCPNYFAWRLEAHYHVPWKPNPLLPREKAVAYLKALGRDPTFFETSIFRRTNWEVLGALGRLGFVPRDIGTLRSMAPSLANLPSILRRPVVFWQFYNPFRHSVVLAASKR
jgi:2-polyprenyl-3-methyl-5-hydroxy-6-metoxy-1,4-benzoquinol methylase